VTIVRKEVKEIKISVTPEEFLKKSWKVGKKKLHRRKIVPVIIWDFGGQDVFYSTLQTFFAYRAIYMLVLDGSDHAAMIVPVYVRSRQW
jgi:GTPase SAR1 family protein